MLKKLFPAILMIAAGLFVSAQAQANVSGVTCSPSPQTVNTDATYTITFTTGGSGALSVGDNINITFPTNTSVPASIPAGAQVTVNGSNITNATSRAGQIMTIQTPTAVANSTLVTIVISTGASSLTNPSLPGNKTIQVNTVREGTNVSSSNYSITASGTTLVVNGASVSPDTIGNIGAYSFSFNTAADGDLIAGSTMTIVFPTGTVIPGSPSTTGLTVNGTQVSAASGSGTTLTLTLNGVVAGSTNNVNVVIPVGANIRNTTTGGTYSLSVATSSQPTAGSSGTFTIGTSSTALVLGATVTVNPDTISNIGAYSFTFNTSSDGALLVGSTMTIVFDAATTVPASPSTTGLTVNGTQVSAASGSGSTLTLTLNGAIAASTNNINVVIPVGAGIRNPGTTGSKTLSVSTSVQTIAGTRNYTINTSSTQLVVGAVTVSPNTVNNIGAYSFTFNTAANGALVVGSTVTITFAATTVVPASPSTTGLTVNGVQVSAASGSGTTLTLTLNGAIAASTNNVNVTIPVGAGIQNTSTTGVKTLSVATSAQPIAGSNTYTIAASGTQLVVGAVTVSPLVICNIASYSFTFNTSADGALVVGSTVTIGFPVGTVVPASPSTTGLTVNGVQVSAASGSGTNLTLTLNGAIAASTNNVNVTIPVGAGIRNPTATGTYSLSVATSVQTTAGTSGTYTLTTVAATVNITSVTPSPSTVGNNAQYTVVFTNDANGVLIGGTSHIFITFPAGTAVHNGALTGVTVQGGAATATGTSATRVVDITVPSTINGSATITVVIPTNSPYNLQNPITAGSGYTLQASTTTQPNADTSATYSITTSATAPNITGVTVTPLTIGCRAQYSVTFSTSVTDGGLGAGTSQIVITFPVGTTVFNGALGGVTTVNGTNAVSAVGDSALRTVTIVPTQDIATNTSITVVIPSTTTGIRNPTALNTYNLQVHTTSQPNDGSGGNYTTTTFATPVSGIAAAPVASTIGNNAQYTITFSTDATNGDMVGTISQIVITFPVGTTITAGPIAGVTVNGAGATSASGNSAARTITIVPSATINGGGVITVVVPSAGDAIRNPAMAGTTYQLQVNTSPQPNNGSSVNYTIDTSGTLVTAVTATPSPSTIGNYAQYTVAFTTNAASGDLLADYSLITITFPVGTVIANGPVAGVTVNGVAASSATGNSGARTITVVPNQFINGGTAVSVVIPSTGDAIRNPTTAGAAYQIQVNTAPQPNNAASANYTIDTSLTPVGTPNVTVSPNTIGNSAQYTIVFTTDATSGNLVGGTSTITITFLSDTFVRSPNLSNVTVNGAAATATGSGLVVTVNVPSDIAGGSTITVVIPTNTPNNLRNPTTGGNYTLSVHTTPQPVNANSNPFGIGQSSTPITVTSVTPSPAFPGDDVSYAITFGNSADGPLYTGSSHIIVTLPDDTYVPTSGSLTGVLVNGTSASATGNGATRVVNITTPVDIAASASISLTIPNLHNPTCEGTGNTLSISTTVQPVGYGPGAGYSITRSGTATGVAVMALSPIVNVPSAYSTTITTSVVLRANKGQIIFTFPTAASIQNGALSGITINGSGALVTSATGNAAASTVTIIPSADLTAGSIRVFFPVGIVLLNPSTTGTNTLAVATSSQASGSGTFSLNPAPSTITQPRVTFPGNFSRAGEAGDYQIDFNVGQFGRLSGGNIITVTFPAGTGMPTSISSNLITVNGAGTTGTSVVNGQTVIIVVPPTVSVANNGGPVTVRFASPGAGVLNPSIGYHQLPDVHTDAEPTVTMSDYYFITSDTHITTPQVTVTPATIFANAQYIVDFTMGAGGSLTQGIDIITLTFPTAVNIPTTLSGASITVNGTVATTAHWRAGNIVEITSPITIAPVAVNKAIRIIFSTAAGITNPVLPGDFSLSGFTSIENTPVPSNTFHISASTSTFITQPQVNLFPAFTRSAGKYRLNFNLGAYGGLLGGTSTISVQFPANVVLPGSVPAGYITVNGQPTLAAATVSGQVLTITVPATLAVNAAVELIIEARADVKNPSDAGDYTLMVYTSSEPTPVQSTTFHIAIATWNDIIAFPNPLAKQNGPEKLITFFLIPSNEATLRVYTLDGHLVKTITKNDNGDKIVWDVKNENGSYIASGIYIYNITGPGGAKKGKLAIKN